METIIHFFNTHITITHNDILLWILNLFLLWGIYSIHKTFNKKINESEFEWLDLISINKHLSLTKTLNLIGGLIGGWVVIKMTLQSTLTFDIFLIYLGYCAGTEGFSKYLAAKYSKGK